MDQKQEKALEQICEAAAAFVERTAAKENANPAELEAMARIAVCAISSRPWSH